MEKTESSLKRAPGLAVAWAPFSIVFLGFWLLASSATFGYCGSALCLSDQICGVLFLILGWLFRNPTRWASWLIALIGVWLQFAPLWLRIPQAVGYLNDTLIGLLAIFFSFVLFPEKEPAGNDIPKGWTYNPSAYAQRVLVILLTGICWFLARYLAAYQMGFISTMWDPFFGDGTVRVITSNISQALSVPDAGLGAFAYTLEFLLGCHGGRTRWRSAPWLVLSFGLLVVPVGLVSILLIILQPIVVHSWCTVCIITAFSMLLMIMFTIDEVAACLQHLKRGCKAGYSFWSLLFFGWTEERKEHRDTRDVPLHAPFPKIAKVLFLGCGMPWNLLCAALCGVVFMVLPGEMPFVGLLANVDYILGALIVVVACLAMAEVLRKARFLLCIFAPLIAIAAIEADGDHLTAIHLVLSAVTFALAFRKGKIKERFSK